MCEDANQVNPYLPQTTSIQSITSQTPDSGDESNSGNDDPDQVYYLSSEQPAAKIARIEQSLTNPTDNDLYSKDEIDIDAQPEEIEKEIETGDDQVEMADYQSD